MKDKIIKQVEQEWGEIKHEGIRAIVMDAISIALEKNKMAPEVERAIETMEQDIKDNLKLKQNFPEPAKFQSYCYGQLNTLGALRVLLGLPKAIPLKAEFRYSGKGKEEVIKRLRELGYLG